MTAESPIDPVFRALADPTRRSILSALVAGPHPVHLLADRFPVSRPAISRHLRLLKEAGLVSEHRRGRERIYRLEPENLDAAATWLAEALMAPAAAPVRVEPSRPKKPRSPRRKKPRRKAKPRPTTPPEPAETPTVPGEWKVW